jgi:hypothetical protein
VAGELLDHYVSKFADNVAGGVASQIKVGAELPMHEGDITALITSTRLVQPLARLSEPDGSSPVALMALAFG